MLYIIILICWFKLVKKSTVLQYKEKLVLLWHMRKSRSGMKKPLLYDKEVWSGDQTLARFNVRQWGGKNVLVSFYIYNFDLANSRTVFFSKRHVLYISKNESTKLKMVPKNPNIPSVDLDVKFSQKLQVVSYQFPRLSGDPFRLKAAGELEERIRNRNQVQAASPGTLHQSTMSACKHLCLALTRHDMMWESWDTPMVRL